jgi:hypothetical protein
MNAHSKPLRVVALDGIWELDQNTGHYERLEIFEEEPRWPLWRLCYGWPAIALVIGIAAYAVWRVFAG